MSSHLFIQFYSEKIGKPESDFSPEDWKEAALSAAKLIDSLSERRYAAPKRRGRPKIKNTLAALVKRPLAFINTKTPKQGTRGRPRALYYGYTAEELAELVKDVSRPEISKRWPNAPKKKRDVVKAVSRVLKGVRGGHHDVGTLERAIRRAETNKK